MQQSFANFGSFSQPPQQQTRPGMGQSVGAFSSVQGNVKFNQAAGSSNIVPMNTTELPAIQIPAKPRLKVNLNNNERGYYSSMLFQADPTESNKVQGKGAVAFFKKFGLSVEILKKIWMLAASNQDYLDREDFYVALKLISFAQNGIDVSEDSIIKNIPSPLPKFAEAGIKKEEQGAPAEIDDKAREIPAPLMTNALQQQQQQIDNQPPQQQLKQMPLQQQAHDSNIHRPSMNFTGFQNVNQSNNAKASSSSLPAIIPSREATVEFLKNYEKYYATADPTNKGEISGNEAREIFLRSALPNPVLFKIWNLVDTRKSGSLKKPEFLVALHLIMLAKRGEEIADVLPENLSRFILEFKSELEVPANPLMQQLPNSKNSSKKGSIQGAADNLMDFDNSEIKEDPIKNAAKKSLDKCR